MHVTRLTIAGLRRCAHVELLPGPGLNLLTGDNGAGKTSLLEALHLMAYGRSFRGRVRDGLISTGAEALEVFVEWRESSPQAKNSGGTAGAIEPAEGGKLRKAGLRHTGQAWQGRLDGADVAHLGDLCAALAVVTFEPGSHIMLSGGGEPRRRYLDWGLFHVEPAFLVLWRRYARALRQRNTLLKARVRDGQLDAWERELADTGEPLTRYRQHYLDALQAYVQAECAALLPSAGDAALVFQPGWRREELALGDALLLARERDLANGHTSVGPHRADWRLDYRNLPGREALSRGQAKLSVLALLLAQAGHYADSRGHWPVVALDDLASELDRQHQRRLLDRLAGIGAQLFVTGTEPPEGLAALDREINQFHVEQGRVVLLEAATNAP